MDWLAVILLVVGLAFIIFSLLLLFKRGFVEKLRQGIWKPKEYEVFPEKEGYSYDKYTRGIGLLVAGLLMVVFAIYSLL